MIRELVASASMAGGAILGVIAYTSYTRKKAKLANSYQTVGEVIDIKQHPGGEDGPTNHPVIRFTAQNGEEVVFESKFGASNWMVAKGEKMKVAVNQSDPSDAEVVRFMAQWGKPLILGIIAVSFVEAAVLACMFLKN